MAERASVFNVGVWGLESTLGVQVASTKRLLATAVDPNPQVPTNPYRPTGFIQSTSAVQLKESTALAISGAISYPDLPYLLSSLLKTGVVSTPAGGTLARRWTFSPGSTAPDTFTSYSIEKGTAAAGAERITGCVVTDLSMNWTDRDAALTGNMMGQKTQEQITVTGGPTDIPAVPVDPKSVSVYVGSAFNTSNVQTVTLSVVGGAATGGTFTLTFENLTTAAIAFNANAAAVQTALVALTNLGGNVTVGGGPGPSSAYTVTFNGILAGVDATALTANGAALTGPGAPYANPTVTNTTPGGMTKLLRCLSCDFAISSRYVFPFTLNDADPSWSFAVQQGVEASRCTMVLEHDSVSAGYMTTLRARTTYYAKIIARGAAIETVGGIVFPYNLTVLFPFKFVDPSRQDTGGVYTSTFPLAPMYDPTFAGWLTVTVDTNYSTL